MVTFSFIPYKKKKKKFFNLHVESLIFVLNSTIVKRIMDFDIGLDTYITPSTYKILYNSFILLDLI